MSSGSAPAPLLDRLPAPLADRLACVRICAEELGCAVWWVGGGVRDLHLGRTSASGDLDFVLETDPTPLARATQARLGGRIVLHEQFLTVSLETSEGCRIDFARARKEIYPRPGSLPQVTAATLEEDLRRRDFALNAMALRLAPLPHELSDPCSGRADLETRSVRILHSESFVDDPTRILRGIRFEVRLGFAFDARTKRAAEAALRAGALETISGDRLRKELELLFESWMGAAAALARLDALGVLGALGASDAEAPAGSSVSAAAETVASLDWARARLRPPSPWALVRLALLLGSDPARRDILVDRLASPSDRGRLRAAPDRVRSATRSVGEPRLLPHQISLGLEPLGSEELLWLASRGEHSKRVVDRHLVDQRGLELSVTGSDLLAAGVPSGPAIGRALRETRNARIDGEIGPEEEIEFALEAARAREAR